MPRPKTKTSYVCDRCGNESPRWEGRCPSCGEWNTMAEFRHDRPKPGGRTRTAATAQPPTELSQVSSETLHRLRFSSGEVNRVLGSGVVPGSLVVIAGEPGIGKSTLLLRMASDIASGGGTALYVTGEESMAQVKIRADRLGISGERLVLLHATALDEIMGHLAAAAPDFAVVDSIQTVHDDALDSAAGSVAQVRECTRALMAWAKAGGVPMVLSGHVTKGGDIAGPRALEHMVDVVLYMEGETVSSWRLLRAVKNRFGSTNEVGVFEMAHNGLVEVPDPSRAFLAERTEGAVGSVVVATLEGSRPMLAEVQALTSPSVLPAPRRVATGIDFSRLLLVCAVLTRRAGLSLANEDVVVNVTGGLRIAEPAADLGLALAIASSLRNTPVSSRVAAVGEIGLTGEVRRVPQLERRLDEVSRLGLAECLVPGSWKQGTSSGATPVPVSTVSEALAKCLPAKPGRPAASRAPYVRTT